MSQFQTNEVSPVFPSVGGGGITILVFKTNLSDVKRVNDVESLLKLQPHIIKWNVDLDDCDNVLRIVSRNITGAEIENILLSAGWYCEELL